MTTSAEAYDMFSRPMAERFLVPQGLDSERYLTDVASELTGFTRHQLESAATSLTRTRKQRTFPTIAECIEVCGSMPIAPVVSRQATVPDYVGDSRRWQEGQAQGVAMVRSLPELARVAHQGRWLPELIEFCVKKGRAPIVMEQQGLASAAEDRWRETGKFRDGLLAESMRNLRIAMERRAARDVFGVETDEEGEIVGEAAA